MQKNLVKLVYIPTIRLFQMCKAMNANTVTESNGPTMKYHFTVVLSEKNKTKQNKKVVSDYGSTTNEAKQDCFLLKFST